MRTYIADRYSAIQQQEIRDIMEAATQNEKRLNEPEQQKREVPKKVSESIDATPDKESFYSLPKWNTAVMFPNSLTG